MKKITISKRCIECGEEFTFEVTEEGLKKWREGELIQRCFPELSPGMRELLISGICGRCFSKMFK
jgi:hypothetical protein